MNASKYFLLSIFLCILGCVTSNTQDNFQQKLNEANRETQEYILTLEENKEFPNDSRTDFLSLFATVNCQKGARLLIDSSTQLFVVKRDKDRNCVKKWSDMFITELNKRYNFYSIGYNYSVNLISDVSNLQSIDFNSIETNTRTRFKQLFENKVAELNRQIQYKRQRQAEAEEQARSEAILQGSRQISEALTQGYSSPQPASYTPTRQIDYECQNRCLKSGYMFDFCNSKCSY